jgi:AbiTii
MSLLREIQSELATSRGDVTNVLRKCKILAARLGSKEFAQWVDWELNGYPVEQQVLGYRQLGVTWFGDFMSAAWQANGRALPSYVFPEHIRDKIDRLDYRPGIATVASFVETGARTEEPELAALIGYKCFRGMNCVRAYQFIPGSTFEQLISAVKSRILDFVLEIECGSRKFGSG